jgi:glycine dehydrogenase subunit 1
MAYIPHTPGDRQRMLAALGLNSLDELLAGVPEAVRLQRPLNLPAALPEWEVQRQLAELGGQNRNTTELASFLGGGAYDHFVPAAITHLTRRSEFATAYTPYQPEVSQGTLQAIFEFQTAIARLVGLPVANASLYDGATACAEAVLLAQAETGGRHVIVSEAVHPHTRSVVQTYLKGRKHPTRIVKTPTGVTDPEAMVAKAGRKPACLVISQPNCFGQIEDVTALAHAAHQVGALCVVSVDPIAMGLLEAPGRQGADIVVGEGQALGLAQNFGGPYLGFLASRRELTRRLPGRLIGMSTDRQGRRAYVMTLQTREQHIRRERATSNICTNQGLCALAATIYLSLVGPTGLRKAAELCLQKAHYMAEQLAALTGFRLRYSGPFFKEFVLETPSSPAAIIRKLLGEGILAGIDLGRLQGSWRGGLLIAVTEKRTRVEIDRYVDALRPYEARAAITEALARQMSQSEAPNAGTPESGDAQETRMQTGQGG